MGRQTKKWTTTEVEQLRAFYKTKGPTVLAKELNRTRVAVQRKAFYLGLSDNTPGHMTEAQLAQLRKVHEATRQRATMIKANPEYKARRRRIITANAKIRRSERRDKKICLYCDEASLEHSTSFCLLHWASVMGHTCKHYDIAFARMLLDKLEQQNYRCALTGDLLIPSFNCSVDHIIPKSKGGSIDDPDNLRWVTIDANRSKGNMSDDEFIAFCQRVIAHNSK